MMLTAGELAVQIFPAYIQYQPFNENLAVSCGSHIPSPSNARCKVPALKTGLRS